MGYLEFGIEMRRRREAVGMSCEGLGQELGVTRVTVWRWESGVALPRTVELYDRWCGVLGVDVRVVGVRKSKQQEV